ncbi:MAG: hypothetical protein QHH04_00025 [Methanolinea sp.]|nr:hypothetical protein [Methanolinea sp.]
MKKSKGKEKKTGSGWNLQKIGIIVIGVSFAIIMVVSSLGMSWLITLNPAAAGDHATVALTLYDETGRPVLTSDLKKFNQTYEAGNTVWLCGPLSMYVGETNTKEIVSVPVFNYMYGESKYALFSPEYNAITQGIAGMKQGETKKIAISPIGGLEREMTPEQFEAIGGNFTMVVPGEQIILGFAEQPTVSVETNETPSVVIRTGYVTSKTADGVRVNFACPTAEVSIRELTKV